MLLEQRIHTQDEELRALRAQSDQRLAVLTINLPNLLSTFVEAFNVPKYAPLFFLVKRCIHTHLFAYLQ